MTAIDLADNERAGILVFEQLLSCGPHPIDGQAVYDSTTGSSVPIFYFEASSDSQG